MNGPPDSPAPPPSEGSVSLPAAASRLVPSPELANLLADLLREQASVRLTVWGSSMLPLLQNGDLVELEPAASGQVRPGEVLAFRGEDGSLIVHRLVTRRRTPGGDWLVLWPDAGFGLNGPLPGEALLGRVVAAYRAGEPLRLSRRIPLSLRCYAGLALWRVLHPRLWPATRALARPLGKAWLHLPSLAVALRAAPVLGPLLLRRARRVVTQLEIRRIPAGPPPHDRDWSWLAVWRGRVLGQVGLGYTFGDQIGSPSMWIAGLWVNPWHRRSGLATRLVSEAVAFARERGLTPVYAAIRHDNTASFATFSKLGFVRVEEPALQAGVDRWFQQVAGWPPGAMVLVRLDPAPEQPLSPE